MELSQVKEAYVDKYFITPSQIITFFFLKFKIHQSTNPFISLQQGFLGTQNVTSLDEHGEYPDFEIPARFEQGQSIRGSYVSQRFKPRNRETEDDWELPKDYL